MADVPVVELVLTLPNALESETAFTAHARTTLGALIQMIASCAEELVIGAPYIRGEILTEHGILEDALSDAVNHRHVHLSIVTTGESLAGFNRVSWISAQRTHIRFYRPKGNVEAQSALGSHAKFCIADRQMAYIGSANLTWAGLHEHFEMGVLLHDSLAHQVADLWKILVGKGFFVSDDSLP
jgi:phosphatidylserine/phosphatidylglycerophosphate/cardiolipin synthase-like enzyme